MKLNNLEYSRKMASAVVHRGLIKGKEYKYRNATYIMKNKKLYVRDETGEYLSDISFNGAVEIFDRISPHDLQVMNNE